MFKTTNKIRSFGEASALLFPSFSSVVAAFVIWGTTCKDVCFLKNSLLSRDSTHAIDSLENKKERGRAGDWDNEKMTLYGPVFSLFTIFCSVRRSWFLELPSKNYHCTRGRPHTRTKARRRQHTQQKFEGNTRSITKNNNQHRRLKQKFRWAEVGDHEQHPHPPIQVSDSLLSSRWHDRN